ncbi:MAG: ABC transporter substrate-binding protein [Deltaproteobacteria bacterium]|nr:ABC transporter substrate-binding protein [Deltaproteobacteria bacterium]
MEEVKLAYRDNDRTPVIFCIKEIAKRHYGIDVKVKQIRGAAEYESAVFDGSADVIIERMDYLFAEAVKGRKVTMFCCPVITSGMEMVVPSRVKSIDDLRGKKIAVRAAGRPFTVALRLRKMGLEKDVERIIVSDDEVGRWGQWKKVVSGECIATYMTAIYLPDALAAGLKVLETPELQVIGHFAQACSTEFARENHELLGNYVRSVVHALCLMKYKRAEAMEIVSQEPMRLMKLQDRRELERQVDSIIHELQVRPYPTPEGIANSHEISTDEWPVGKSLENPLTLWDLHWLKQLDDEGFIDGLIKQMEA